MESVSNWKTLRIMSPGVRRSPSFSGDYPTLILRVYFCCMQYEYDMFEYLSSTKYR